MVRIVFRNESRADTIAHASEGSTLLDIAVANLIPGIVGDCGGQLNCGTCHAYIDESSLEKLAPPSIDEQIMIDDGVVDPRPNSRMCCQIVVSSAVDHMVVTVPNLV